MAWFAYDIDEYDADTMHLSALEDGVYMRLLRFYYKTRLPLPDDDRALANIARVPLDQWETIKGTIRAFFKPRRGKLHQKRCDRELDREDSFAKKRSEHAKRAIEKRWAKSRAKIPPVYSENESRSASAIPDDTTRPDQTDSEAIASAAGAAAVEPEVIPLDTKAAIFGEQLAWLRENTGRSEKSLRSWLGQCCGKYGDAAVLAAILTIRSNPTPVDPISRMRSILEKPEGSVNGSGKRYGPATGIAKGFADALRAGEGEPDEDSRPH